MEGYFPIIDYCKLAQVDRDTAYHRAIRGTVDSFKDKDGRIFIYYYQDETKIPDNFITMTEYARRNHISYSAIHLAMTRGEFKSEDIIVLPPKVFKGGARSKIYMNPDAKRAKITYEMRALAAKPEGYLTANEWCVKHRVSKSNFNQMILFDRIPTIKIGEFRYVKKDQPLPKDRRRKNDY